MYIFVRVYIRVCTSTNCSGCKSHTQTGSVFGPYFFFPYFMVCMYVRHLYVHLSVFCEYIHTTAFRVQSEYMLLIKMAKRNHLYNWSLRQRSAAAFLPVLPQLLQNRISGHTTREPPVGFELVTHSIQFYAIAICKLWQDICDHYWCTQVYCFNTAVATIASQLAATNFLEENVLPLLQYWLSLKVKRVFKTL